MHVPINLYLMMTHAYFCFYHAISNVLLRRVSLPSPPHSRPHIVVHHAPLASLHHGSKQSVPQWTPGTSQATRMIVPRAVAIWVPGALLLLTAAAALGAQHEGPSMWPMANCTGGPRQEQTLPSHPPSVCDVELLASLDWTAALWVSNSRHSGSLRGESAIISAAIITAEGCRQQDDEICHVRCHHVTCRESHVSPDLCHHDPATQRADHG